jgi:hypothetical protein
MREHLKARMKIDAKGCWIWQGGTNENGYGRMRLANPRRQVYPHRAAYEAFIGPIPDGLKVLHRCDVPRCINPNHLFIGTQKDNIRDCNSKGRLVNNQGEKHGMVKLTEDQVREIRAAAGSHAKIGRAYGVSDSTVRYIRQRKLWKHVA